MVILSLSAPEVPGVVPPMAIPYPVEVLIPVLMMQFLIILFVDPNPIPGLTIETAVGAVVDVLLMVRFRLVPPLLLPSIIILDAPFILIMAFEERLPPMVGETPEPGLIVRVFAALDPEMIGMVIGKISSSVEAYVLVRVSVVAPVISRPSDRLATAVAVTPLVGGAMVTVGAEVYPLPKLVILTEVMVPRATS